MKTSKEITRLARMIAGGSGRVMLLGVSDLGAVPQLFRSAASATVTA